MSESERYGANRPQVLVAASDVNMGTELALALGECGVKAPVTSYGEAHQALSVTDPCLVVWTAERMTPAMFALLRTLGGFPVVVATAKPVDSNQLPEGAQVVLGSGANAARRIAAIARQRAQAQTKATGTLPLPPQPPAGPPSTPVPTRPHNPASIPPPGRSNPPPAMPRSNPPPAMAPSTPPPAAKLPPLPQPPSSLPPPRHQTSRPPPPSARTGFSAPPPPRVPSDLAPSPDLDEALARSPSTRPPAPGSNRPRAPASNRPPPPSSKRPPAPASVRPPAPASNRPPPLPSNRPPPPSVRPPAPQPASSPPPLPQRAATPPPLQSPVFVGGTSSQTPAAAQLLDADEEFEAVNPVSPRRDPALMPESVAPVISSPPPARRRGRLWLLAGAVVLLGGGGVAIWKADELQQLVTGGGAAANESSEVEQPAPAASEKPPPKDAEPKKPAREKPSSDYADTLREAPELESLLPDRGLLPGLQKASELQLLAMADAADRKQDFETALHFVAHAVERYPDSAKTRQIHVRALLHYGDASAALHQADEYLKQENDRELVLLRGDAVASLGRLEKAVEIWTEGLDGKALAQLSGMALNMGRHHAHRANTAETKRFMRRATLLMPDNLEAATGVVEMLLRQKQGKPAVAWAKRVVEKAPRAGFSHALLGRALVTAGEKEPAIKSLERSVELNPGDGPTVRLLLELRD